MRIRQRYTTKAKMAGPEVGGYDCEFEERPPDRFPSTECPICHLVLREPRQVSCCGRIFCDTCINRVESGRCPTCNAVNFASFPDQNMKRSLYGFRVYCCHQRDGCVWVDTLRELDNHLNERPSPEGRLDGCPFTMVDCVYCHNAFRRRRCKDHESDECPKRPYTCQHCQYSATFEDVTEKHLPTCPLHPVACPTCQLEIKYQEMEHHMHQDCPLTLISCDFHTVGCPVQLARKDMASHATHVLDQHRALLNEHMATHPGEDRSMYTPLLVKLVDMYKELKPEREQKDLVEVQYLLLSLVLGLFVAGSTGPALVLGTLLVLVAIAKLTNITQYFPTSNTFQFTMPEFEKYKSAGGVWYSRSFYTHSRGYRMCLGVCANGKEMGYGTHVSVYAHLMPGVFDDELQWPFQGKVTITLCNQLSGQDSSLYYTINFADAPDLDNIQQVTSGRRAKGYGISEFIAHSKLHNNAESGSQYLKNGCLVFQVKVTK